jgi:7-cyano-7-deazaguanine synthase
MTDPRRALVLFSGGQDSTVCLAWALSRYAHVETIGFDHAMRHASELESRLHVRAELHAKFPRWTARLGDDHLLDLALLDQLTATRPTDKRASQMKSDGLSKEFVPARNLFFFTFAATVADRRGLDVLVAGMCETDFSAYPDSRDNTLKSLQVSLSLALDRPMTIDTPLMWRNKAQTWALTEELGGDRLIDLIVEHTHSCYMGDRTHRHAWGYGCGQCPSCYLREKGYQSWLAS